MAYQPRWLTEPTNSAHEDGSRRGHGSCMLSKVASPLFGTAKKARTVVAKLKTFGQYDPNGKWVEKSSVASTIRVLYMVLNDVRTQMAQNPNYKAVVNMSFGRKINNGNPPIISF